MDQIIEEAVKQKVDQFVTDGVLFTAFDVTKSLRNEDGLDVRHYEVRDLIHAIFDNGDMPSHMVPESRNFKGTIAFVYMPQWKQGETYDPEAIGGCSDLSQTPPPVTTSVSRTPQSVTLMGPICPPTDPDVYVTHTRGRLCIPKELLSKIGLATTGALAYVYKVPGDCLSVGRTPPPIMAGAKCTKMYFVDKSGNIRLSKSALSVISPIPSQYRVVIEGQSILVSKP